VFYSNQEYINVEEDDNAPVNLRSRAPASFRDFLRNFKDLSRALDDGAHGDDGDLNLSVETCVYRDALESCEGSVSVRLQDIKAYDADLGHALERDPAHFMPQLESAAADVLQSLKNKTSEGDEPERQEVQVMLTTDQEPLSIRDLTAEHVSQLVVVPGIVTSAAKTRAKAASLPIQCKDCKNTKIIACKPGMGGVILPRTCDMHQNAQLQDKPTLDPFVVLPNR